MYPFTMGYVGPRAAGGLTVPDSTRNLELRPLRPDKSNRRRPRCARSLVSVGKVSGSCLILANVLQANSGAASRILIIPQFRAARRVLPGPNPPQRASLDIGIKAYPEWRIQKVGFDAMPVDRMPADTSVESLGD
jgi:hypothetical protein